MPAKSKSQQRLFGMVHAYQKGELKDAPEKIKDVADSISEKDAKDFAETKHKKLPNKVKNESNNMKKNTIKLNESQLRKVVEKSVANVIKEAVGPDFSSYYKEPKTSELDKQIMRILYQTIQQLKKLNVPGSTGKNNLSYVVGEIQKIFDGLRNPNSFDFVNRFNENKGSKKNIVSESIKNVDHNNVVPQDIAEQYGFRPEYKGFKGGLELWGKRVDFNPCEDSQQVQILLSKLGIARFTSYNYKGGVRITVKPNPKPEVSQPIRDNDYEYFDSRTGQGLGFNPKPKVPKLNNDYEYFDPSTGKGFFKRPQPNNDYEYFDYHTGKGFGKRPMR